MKARIGVADSSKVVEIEVEDAADLRSQVEEALDAGQNMVWFTDVKGRTVGVPTQRVAFVEIDSEEDRRVGFAP